MEVYVSLSCMCLCVLEILTKEINQITNQGSSHLIDLAIKRSIDLHEERCI